MAEPNWRWSAMQAIEAMRHLAEQLENRATGVPAPRREAYADVAAHLRDTAERVHALSRTEMG